MKKIQIQASRTYEVCIEHGILDRAGELLRSLSGARTAVIVTGEHVGPLYAERLGRSLESADFRVLQWTHPSGERYKTLETYGRLLSYLAENRVGRGDLLLALGGGVTGDLTGFAAATYQRGMDYAQIPTTLLAMVDSSVGGKTAVNLPNGKNLVGCFYQPLTVLCDPSLLQTLPEAEYRCGCAEVIKYAVLGEKALFAQLETAPVSALPESVIARCVERKRDLVAVDEYDRGSRRLLNLGHSFGHAIEACSDYSILHGQAVSIGMAMATRAACARGICPEDTLTALLALLGRFGLPTETDLPLENLREAMLSDKKRTEDSLSLVVPERIGRCRVLPVPVEELELWLRQGGAR